MCNLYINVLYYAHVMCMYTCAAHTDRQTETDRQTDRHTHTHTLHIHTTHMCY